MEEIAQEAHVSRPVVYHHFDTREGVYIACVQRARVQYQRELLAGLDPEATPAAGLARGGDIFFSMLERHPGRWLLLFGSNSVLPSTHADELAAFRFETIDAIAELLRLALPDAPAEAMDVCAHAVSGVGERLGHWWLRNPQVDREQVVGYYTDILWAGLRQYAEGSSMEGAVSSSYP